LCKSFSVVLVYVKSLCYVVVAKHRSRSADTCAIRRPTQEAMKLVERLVDVSTREPPSEYESDVPAVRLSVATSQLQDFDPITPPLPAKLSTLRSATASRQALRTKMNLDGLIACRPQMPTPKCEPFVPLCVDATGMLMSWLFIVPLSHISVIDFVIRNFTIHLLHLCTVV